MRLLTALFVTGVAFLVLAASSAAEAQPASKIPRIGILAQNSPLWEDFRQGLRDLGYVEGRTIVIENRWEFLEAACRLIVGANSHNVQEPQP